MMDFPTKPDNEYTRLSEDAFERPERLAGLYRYSHITEQQREGLPSLITIVLDRGYVLEALIDKLHLKGDGRTYTLKTGANTVCDLSLHDILGKQFQNAYGLMGAVDKNKIKTLADASSPYGTAID